MHLVCFIVRIYTMWDVQNLCKGQGFEFILFDLQGQW